MTFFHFFQIQAEQGLASEVQKTDFFNIHQKIMETLFIIKSDLEVQTFLVLNSKKDNFINCQVHTKNLIFQNLNSQVNTTYFYHLKTHLISLMMWIYITYYDCVVMLGETSILIKRFFFIFTFPPPLMYFCSLHLCANSVTNAIWTLTAAVLSLLAFT
jgi:hypothetical protein